MSLVGGPVSSVVGTPLVNAGSYYVNGLFLTWVSNTTFTISNGAARDSQNQTDIIFPATIITTTTPYTTTPSTLTVNTAQQGALGIDIGTITNSSLYAVYIVGDSLGNNPTTAVISLNFTQPVLPYGYDSYRRIGLVYVDNLGHIVVFDYVGNSAARTMWLDTQIEVLTAGTSAVYAAVALNPYVPPVKTDLIFTVVLTPTAAGNTVNLRPTGSTSTNGYAIMSGDVGGVAHTDQIHVPSGVSAGNASIDYKVTGSVNLFLQGYVDYL